MCINHLYFKRNNWPVRMIDKIFFDTPALRSMNLTTKRSAMVSRPSSHNIKVLYLLKNA